MEWRNLTCLVTLLVALYLIYLLNYRDYTAQIEGFKEKTSQIIIQMNGYQFRPDYIVAPSGTTFTWINFDPEPHQLSSDGPINSPKLGNSDQYSVQLTEAGMYYYSDALNPAMRGTIKIVSQNAF